MDPLKIALIIVAIILSLSIITIFLNGFLYHNFVFKRRKNDKHFAENEDPKIKNSPLRKWLFKQKMNELKIVSKDKLKLKGYLISQKSDKLAILCHGYHGRYYSSTAQAKIFYDNGYDVLLINNRSHDTSKGRTFTMGPKEVDDLLRWINLMITKNEKYQILLHGVSMGGHIVMLTVGNKELPKNVKCFIEDCGYASLDEELLYQFEQKISANLKFFNFCLDVYCRLFHHFTIKSSTEKSLSKTLIPGLFIHGDKDDYVPFTNLETNFSYMNGVIPAKKVVFKNANHNEAIKDYDKYEKEVISFANKYIK